MASEETSVFFDTHCHLQDVRFQPDLAVRLLQAREAGITNFVCCGTQESDWDAVLEVAMAHPAVLPMLGLHPWFAYQARPGWLERLAERLQNPCIGLGECGLDFAIEEPQRELQESAFRGHLRLACDLNRPVSIHCRHAWERLMAIAREEGLPKAGAVIHAFSGSAEMAREAQTLGFYLAFGCSLTNPNNHRAAKALKVVAEDRLLFETDAPDMPPYGSTQGTLNDPANLRLAVEAASRVRGIDPEALASVAYRNSCRVFRGMLPTA
ncbi:MAG: TatD family hydrolase [Holophaga sp.]|nr:TatD family hydrolase [Holophaga sp.]